MKIRHTLFATLFIALNASCYLFLGARTANGSAAGTGHVARTPADTQSCDTDSVVPPSWSEQLHARLQPLIDEAERSSYYMGLCIYDLTADTLITAYNQQKSMRPASTQKLLTAISALDLYGKQYRYNTNVYRNGDNVHIVGAFDPLISTDDLRNLARTLQEQFGDTIRGLVIADVSMKDTCQLGNGWCWDDVPSNNIPYLTPLFFNHELPIDLPRDVKGRPLTLKPKFVFHPEQYFLTTLADELKALGVGVAPRQLTVQTQTLLAPQATGRLIFQCSHTFEQALQPMMKQSDNLFAESMFYQLGLREKSQGVTWKEGAHQVESVLRRAGVDTDRVKVADGSGISLYNYVSPQAEVTMLRYAYRQRAIFDALYPSLPIAGIDGTLDTRMVKGAAKGNVHAKTGTVTGVTCLAGYVRASNGNLLAFSIMHNGVMKAAIGRDHEDRICEALAQ